MELRVKRHFQLFGEDERDQLDRIPLDLRQALRSPPVAARLSAVTKARGNPRPLPSGNGRFFAAGLDNLAERRSVMRVHAALRSSTCTCVCATARFTLYSDGPAWSGQETWSFSVAAKRELQAIATKRVPKIDLT
jgi:hypothetical protein